MGEEYNRVMQMKLGGSPPYDPPPDGQSELDWLNHHFPDAYWTFFAIVKKKQLTALEKLAETSIIGVEIIKPVGDNLFAVRLPRHLINYVKLGKREEHDGETGFRLTVKR